MGQITSSCKRKKPGYGVDPPRNPRSLRGAKTNVRNAQHQSVSDAQYRATIDKGERDANQYFDDGDRAAAAAAHANRAAAHADRAAAAAARAAAAAARATGSNIPDVDLCKECAEYMKCVIKYQKRATDTTSSRTAADQHDLSKAKTCADEAEINANSVQFMVGVISKCCVPAVAT